MAKDIQADPWTQHRERGYLPDQPGYISTLSAIEMSGPSYRPEKWKCSFALDPFKMAIITGIVIAVIALTIFLLKHYRIF
jgi:hypothetical protein